MGWWFEPRGVTLAGTSLVGFFCFFLLVAMDFWGFGDWGNVLGVYLDFAFSGFFTVHLFALPEFFCFF